MARREHTLAQCLDLLEEAGSAENRAGMARFGIETENAFGVSMPNIRAIAKDTVKDHKLAEALWRSGKHEARILACLVDKPEWVTPEPMERWVVDFNSWDVCDQVCGNLFDRTPLVDDKIMQWSGRPEEFVKRAAIALIAWRAVHAKKEPDTTFERYLPLIEREAGDNRNFVKKAVNWALRQVGKRSAYLNAPALQLARQLAASDNPVEIWVGKDAQKELESDRLRQRLGIA